MKKPPSILTSQALPAACVFGSCVPVLSGSAFWLELSQELLAVKYPGTKSGKQEESPSQEGACSVCVCCSGAHPALSSRKWGGMSVRCVCAGVTAAQGRRTVPWACCKGGSLCLAARSSCLIAAPLALRVGNTMPAANAPRSVRRRATYKRRGPLSIRDGA